MAPSQTRGLPPFLCPRHPPPRGEEEGGCRKQACSSLSCPGGQASKWAECEGGEDGVPHWAPNGKGSQPPPPPPTDRGGPGVLPRPHGPGSQGCHPRSLGRAEAQGCYLLGELHGHAEPTPRTQGLGPACPPARNSCRQGPLPTPCPGQERPHGRGAGPVGSGPGGRAPRVAQPRLGNSDFTLVLTP